MAPLSAPPSRKRLAPASGDEAQVIAQTHATMPARPLPPQKTFGDRARRRPLLRASLRLTLAILLLFAALILPSHPAGLTVERLWRLPLEVPAILFALCLLRGRAFAWSVLAVALFTGLSTFLKLADLGTFSAFSRPFNPMVDVPIMVAGWHLLTGTIGLSSAIAAIVGALVLWFSTSLAIAWGLLGLARLPASARRPIALVSLIVLVVGAAFLSISGSPRLTSNAVPFLTERLALMQTSLRDLAAFNEKLGDDPLADLPADARYSALAGKDVVILFVESYGRSVVEDPRYASQTTDRLRSVEAQLTGTGYGIRSGWVTSPTMGGQSWLAHGTLLSGLWTDDQARYDRLIASRRESLNRLFQRSGWSTIAVMPAITMDWPEAGWFGYDEAYPAAALDYRGLPFNWVTMPDQFTLAALEDKRRALDEPVMAEVALISSHAPWTPIPHLVPWEAVGDGSIFDEQAKAGDPPSVVWADPERVRLQYAKSIDYALETIGSYVSRFGKDTVFIVLGDHQPASIITGPDASRDVPIHVIADDPAVLNRIADWGFARGMIPPEGPAAFRMDDFRERFTRAMSGE
ncbi:Phosphoglycerol transferase MdoB [Fulvimarina manganoxydans]|uniref:Phosphoglycerol transferase MdoB n=1 Tax=Fulvimarina manganoxydans TaxID=937218 RepID=A0A1W2AUT8_9HYPH|nr:sulfatase-like hydrolase/transferase [Fulvimarina manganoxydans]SMC64497.1 Phosphoglycerol transferase MdoB [Fulvimarina manganoxydans]